MSAGRSGRQGPTVNVQRALGWNGVPDVAQRAQVASCTQCGAELRFTTGEYGQTLEVCTNGACPGRRPHRVQPDPAAEPKDPWVPKKRRTGAQAHPQSEE